MAAIDSTDLSRLSARQRQCLELVGQGLTSKEIGRRLGLSPSTVDNHISAALERLNLTDRATAARMITQSSDQTDDDLRQEAETPTRSPLALPPLSGQINELSAQRRVWHVVQIALIGIMGMAAAIVTIAGLVSLFSGLI
jgi:DNA-binding CsgD family transcriptional regulator